MEYRIKTGVDGKPYVEATEVESIKKSDFFAKAAELSTKLERLKTIKENAQQEILTQKVHLQKVNEEIDAVKAELQHMKTIIDALKISSEEQ